MLSFEKVSISNVVISTAFGFGNGLPIHSFRKSYKNLLDSSKRFNTTVITKSFTLFPYKGNFNIYNPFTWKHIQRISGGLYNNYGLTNPGCAKVKPILVNNDRLIPSLWGSDYEIDDMIFSLKPKIVEINFECPNRVYDADQIIAVNHLRQMHPSVILIGKIGVNTTMHTVKSIVDAGISIIHAINSVPVSKFRVCDSSPYKKFKVGAISGKPIIELSLRYNEKLKKEINIPIIMGGGVSEMADIKKFRDVGADVVSICSLALLNPDLVVDIIREYNTQ